MNQLEVFLTFLEILSHTGQNLSDTLLQYLSQPDIDFTHCRGQTYDNASNMSSKYKGMQKILKNKNSLVELDGLPGLMPPRLYSRDMSSF